MMELKFCCSSFFNGESCLFSCSGLSLMFYFTLFISPMMTGIFSTLNRIKIKFRRVSEGTIDKK